MPSKFRLAMECLSWVSCVSFELCPILNGRLWLINLFPDRVTASTHHRPTLNGTLGPNWCDPQATFALDKIEVSVSVCTWAGAEEEVGMPWELVGILPPTWQLHFDVFLFSEGNPTSGSAAVAQPEDQHSICIFLVHESCLIRTVCFIYISPPRSHEWLKHGTCAAAVSSMQTENEFFSTVLGLHEKPMNFTALLSSQGVHPSYNHTFRVCTYPLPSLPSIFLFLLLCPHASKISLCIQL